MERRLALAVAASMLAHGLLAAAARSSPLPLRPRAMPVPIELVVAEVTRPTPPAARHPEPPRSALRSAVRTVGKAALVVDTLPSTGTAAVEMVTRDEAGAASESGTASYFDAWALDELPAPKTTPPSMVMARGSLQLRVTLTGDGRVDGVVASSGYAPPPAGVLDSLRIVRFSPPVARGERVSTTLEVTVIADDRPDAGAFGWSRDGLGWRLRVDAAR